MAERTTITCPTCGRRYRWKRRLAGRRVRCKCKASIDVPAQPPQAVAAADTGGEQAGATRMAGAGTGGAEIKNCPSCGAAASADAVICVDCGFNLVTGTPIQSRVNDHRHGGARSKLKAALIHFGFWVLVGVVTFPIFAFGSDYVTVHYPSWRDRELSQRRAEERLETYSLGDWAHPRAYYGAGAGLVVGLLRYVRSGGVDPKGLAGARARG